jgi:hypothetical protein
MSARASLLLACIPWLSATAQVQSDAPSNARTAAAVPPGPAAPVTTAELRGVKEYVLGQGKELLVPAGSGSIVLRREVRDGHPVLVETVYTASGNMLTKQFQATSVGIYPASTRIVLVGGEMWLLRPVGESTRNAPPPRGRVALDGLSGAGSPGRGLTAPAGSASTGGCGIVVPPGQNDAAIGPLTCLLLEAEQGATIPGGIRVFRRGASLEVWKGDVLAETVMPAFVRRPLLVRDRSSRHWLLDPVG